MMWLSVLGGLIGGVGVAIFWYWWTMRELDRAYERANIHVVG